MKFWAQIVSVSFFFFLLTLAPQAQVEESKKTASPELIVFLLHGLTGDAGTFCELSQILNEKYPQVRADALTYSTGNPDLKPYHFVREVAAKVRKYYDEHGLTDSVPYAFIAHSQGGIVSLRYAEDCLKRKKCDVKVPGDLRLVLTLGTPHWGSPLASDSFAQKKSRKKAKATEEVKSLAYGSLGLTLARRGLLRGAFYQEGQWKNPLPEQIQFVNVAGDLGEIRSELSGFASSILFNQFFKLGNSNLREFDLAVDAFSARSNFIYYIQESPTWQSSEPVYHSGQTALPGSYHVIRLPHFSRFNLDGIACFKKGKDHRAWDIVENAIESTLLKNPALLAQVKKDPSSEHYAKSMDNFGVEIAFKMPSGYQRKPKLTSKDIQIQERVAANEQERVQSLKLGNYFLVTSEGFNENFNDFGGKNYSTYHHVGATYSANNNLEGLDFSFHPLRDKKAEKITLDYQVNHRSWSSSFSLEVAPSWSTYAEVFLEPYLPIPASGSSSVTGQLDGRYFNDDVHYGLAYVVSAQSESLGAKSSETIYYLQMMVDRNLAPAHLLNQGNVGHSKILISKTLKQAQWQEVLRQSLNAEALQQQILNHSYQAQAGEVIGRHKNQVFEHFYSTEAFDELEEGQKMTVLGRFGEGSMQSADVPLKDTDRYLVILNSGKIAWMNVVDLDISHLE